MKKCLPVCQTSYEEKYVFKIMSHKRGQQESKKKENHNIQYFFIYFNL